MKKQIHCIVAHPNNKSLNKHLFQITCDFLNLQDEKVVTSDLYDMYLQKNGSLKPYGIGNTEPEKNDIKEEQKKVKGSNLTIIQFPLYWFGFPGILKNYIDRIWEQGFAYPGKFDKSPLCDGRQVMFCITAQSDKNDFSQNGKNGPIEDIIKPLNVAFRFTGHEILKPFIILGVHNKSPDEIQVLIESYKSHLKCVLDGSEVTEKP